MIIFNLSEPLSSSSSKKAPHPSCVSAAPFSQPPLLLSLLYRHSPTSHWALSSSYLLPPLLAFMSPSSAPFCLPPICLVLCLHSFPASPSCFCRSVRHNRPPVSGLARLRLPATCFSSSVSRCLGFVPSASNRLFRVLGIVSS